jgi:hypothetical protein
VYDKIQYQFTPQDLVDMKGKSEFFAYWLESGTEKNQHAGPSAVQALYKEVGEMLEKKTWKMHHYF